MKQTKAYNLEIDVIEVIEKYKKDKNLKSSSSALERIILIELQKQLEYEELKLELEELKRLLKNMQVIQPPSEIAIDKDAKEEEHSNITKSFNKSFSNMPD